VVVAATNDLVDRDKNKFLGKFCFSSLWGCKNMW
jgi:hypothetical protein